MMIYADSILGALKQWGKTALDPTWPGFAFDILLLTSFGLCVYYGFIN